MRRVLLALLLGLFGAAIVHIVILFLIPVYSERNAWSELAAKAPLYAPTRLAGTGSDEELPTLDNPFFSATACRFDLANGLTRIMGEGRVPFWSMSIYDRDGLNVFSLSDRSAGEGQLDIALLTPRQMLELRRGIPEPLSQTLMVEADLSEGIVLIRAFGPDESWGETVEGFLDSIRCMPQ